jgi:hypothetical protein
MLELEISATINETLTFPTGYYEPSRPGQPMTVHSPDLSDLRPAMAESH